MRDLLLSNEIQDGGKTKTPRPELRVKKRARTEALSEPSTETLETAVEKVETVTELPDVTEVPKTTVAVVTTVRPVVAGPTVSPGEQLDPALEVISSSTVCTI